MCHPFGYGCEWQREDAVLSPPMATHTDEALLRMAMVATDVLAVIEGRKPENPVPPPA